MDPASHISGALKEEEECHSSESGWTKYIGSPATDYYDGGGHGGGRDRSGGANNNGEYDHHTYHDESISDDSMASDASSGPNHNNHHDIFLISSLKHPDEDDAAAHCSLHRPRIDYDDRISNHEEEEAANKTRKKKGCRDNDHMNNKARKEREVDQLKKQGASGCISSSSSSWVWPKQGGGSCHAKITRGSKVRINKCNDWNRRMSKTD